MIHVHNAGPLSLEQRRELAEKLTAVICEVTGKPASSVYARIDEVPRDHFAVGGTLLADRDARSKA